MTAEDVERIRVVRTIEPILAYPSQLIFSLRCHVGIFRVLTKTLISMLWIIQFTGLPNISTYSTKTDVQETKMKDVYKGGVGWTLGIASRVDGVLYFAQLLVICRQLVVYILARPVPKSDPCSSGYCKGNRVLKLGSRR